VSIGWADSELKELLGIDHPVIQAPMARVTTPELVAAVCEAGALGSLGAAMSSPDGLREDIRAVRALTDRPFAVNLFAPLDQPEPAPGSIEAMSALLAQWHERLGSEGPQRPSGGVPAFEDQLAVVAEERPAVFGFTFGIPPAGALAELREAGTAIVGTATTAAEAAMLEDAGCDAIVAQGSEAGGHRGTFAGAFESALIGLVALVPQVSDRVSSPVIAAGGIMDGRGIAAALALGAGAAQLGTAFLACEESAAPTSYVASLAESDEAATAVTDAFTGRPARGVRSPLFDEIETSGLEIPPYPLQAELMTQLMPAAMERGELAATIRLAGQGAPMVRRMPAAELVSRLVREAEAALGGQQPCSRRAAAQAWRIREGRSLRSSGLSGAAREASIAAAMPTALAELPLHSSGKVREMYELGDDLLMVASDRISAYDVVLPSPIPDKGRVLTQMSVFWFETTGHICPNHYISQDVPEGAGGRGLRVRRLEMYPVECVVRGYLSGSGWREYRESGAVCGIELPEGLRESERLPEPIFTPATKAEVGDHDENVDFDRAVEIIGDRPLMEDLRRISIELYGHAAAHAAERGIIIADTKFEFGSSPGAEIVLGDEVLTPDSSRFWPAGDYEAGRSQDSFDKQYVRDWLDESGWDHSPPAPPLPDEVVQNTRAKYIEAYERITGRTLE
jgi:phosphoribosylaminoimidazole-succinocarboxamide synthase